MAGRLELVVGRRPHEVAALAAVVEENVHAPRDAFACDMARRPFAELLAQETTVFVVAHATQHGGPHPEAAKGIDDVRRLSASAAMTLDVGERGVQALSQRL